jgi:hypothetical protein
VGKKLRFQMAADTSMEPVEEVAQTEEVKTIDCVLARMSYALAL